MKPGARMLGLAVDRLSRSRKAIHCRGVPRSGRTRSGCLRWTMSRRSSERLSLAGSGRRRDHAGPYSTAWCPPLGVSSLGLGRVGEKLTRPFFASGLGASPPAARERAPLRRMTGRIRRPRLSTSTLARSQQGQTLETNRSAIATAPRRSFETRQCHSWGLRQSAKDGYRYGPRA
jgi:hypothetical protein